MTCHDVQERLDGLLDGELPAAEAAAVQAHLGTCADCAEALVALKDVIAGAADLPRELYPARDLWPEIAGRIASAHEPKVVPVRASWLAVAAAILVGASSAATYLAVRSTPAAPASAGAAALPATTAAGAVSQGPDEALYAAATDELLDALQARRDTLAPETRAVVDRNLAAIDQALAEIRAALRKDPGNAELSRRLGSVHRRKIEVLQRVVRLSS